MNKQLVPINGLAVLKPIEEGETTYGQIIIPNLGHEKPEMGKVVAVSSMYNYNTDKLLDSVLTLGDIVLIPKLGSQRVVIDGEDFFLCKETEILAIIK